MASINTIIGIIIAIVVVVIIIILFFAIRQASSKSTAPISTADSTYEQEFQQCAQQYATAFQKFLTESPQGFNQSELQTLAQLQQCMNSASNGLAKLAKSLNQNPINILASDLGQAIEIVAAAIGVAIVLPKLVTYVKKAVTNGGTAASVLQNAIVQVAISNGTITADQAAGVSYVLQQQLYPADINATNDLLYALANESIISNELASELASEYDAYMLTDLQSTLSLLPPPPPPPLRR